MSPYQTDAEKVYDYLNYAGFSVHKSGTWFGVYIGEKLPKKDTDFLAYELNLLDALQKAERVLSQKALQQL